MLFYQKTYISRKKARWFGSLHTTRYLCVGRDAHGFEQKKLFMDVWRQWRHGMRSSEKEFLSAANARLAQSVEHGTPTWLTNRARVIPPSKPFGVRQTSRIRFCVVLKKRPGQVSVTRNPLHFANVNVFWKTKETFLIPCQNVSWCRFVKVS